MCMFSGPTEVTDRTTICCFEARHPETDHLIHVMVYDNAVRSLAAGPNCMLLPVPAESVHMGPENMLDLRQVPHLIEDYARAVQARTLGHDGSDSRRGGGARSFDAPQVFEHGSYTVVLAQRAGDIQGALSRVPEDRRPRVRVDLLDALGTLYPEPWHKFLLCCWSGRGGVKPEPVGLWYQPLDRTSLFFPRLDAHDGGVPVVGRGTRVNHRLIAGSKLRGTRRLSRVRRTGDVPATLEPFLADLVCGAELTGGRPNGDSRFPLAALSDVSNYADRGHFMDVLPPGAT